MVATNFPEGCSNVADTMTFGGYTSHDPSRCYEFFEDFFRFDPADWNVALTGTPKVFVAGGALGGALAFVPSAPADAAQIQWGGHNGAVPPTVVSPFQLQLGKRGWFKTSLREIDLNQLQVSVGLRSSSAQDYIIAFTSGLADNTYSLTLKRVAEVKTYPLIDVGLGQAIDFGWYYDGLGRLDVFVNDQRRLSIPDAMTPLGQLSPSIDLLSQTGNGTAIMIDYIHCAFER